MTEAEWLNATDPLAMLTFLQGRATSWKARVLSRLGLGHRVPIDRKLRLFACECCRRSWHLLADEPACREAVEVAERYADGLESRERLRVAWRAAHDRRVEIGEQRGDGLVPPKELAVRAAEDTTAEDSYFVAKQASTLTWEATNLELIERMPGGLAGQAWLGSPELLACSDEQKRTQAHLLRDLFGPLPFRAVPVKDTWLRWNDGTVPKIAQATYDERRFEDLPILADALEDAGCDSDNILSHCRLAGEHVKGCWVIDLLLKKG